MKVTWFRHGHEQRNDMLRLGMLRLNHVGDIDYREYPLARCSEYGFSQGTAGHSHRHTSVLAIGEGRGALRCIVDSEDSFLFMSPIIQDADVYFCAGYNSDFFESRRLACAYPWQTPGELRRYEARVRELAAAYGDRFGSVRKFVPICPNMAPGPRPSFLQEKARNLRHRAHLLYSRALYTGSAFEDLEARYCEILALRAAPLIHDIVASDTLWGWPRHRLALHQRLAALSDRYDIHAELRWSEPSEWDGSATCPLSSARFPMRTGDAVFDFEPMLASSRLVVLATGYHWGWRNVMTLALMIGLPVYADRIRLEPWFDLSGFEIFDNDENDWPDLESLLASIDETRREEIKSRNQQYFDQVMTPEAQARYVLRSLESG